LVAFIENAIVEIREDKTKTKGIKFLRSLNKDIKDIKSQTIKVLKQKEKKSRNPSNNSNSGFKKPVVVSSELAKFAGWKDDELHSRVDVTKYICNYIKIHDLQNPEDRRQINPDSKLKQLLGISDDELEPLKYYSLQTYLKRHYPKSGV
jgi:chromatin remodeling complex protein RSC6